MVPLTMYYKGVLIRKTFCLFLQHYIIIESGAYSAIHSGLFDELTLYWDCTL